MAGWGDLYLPDQFCEELVEGLGSLKTMKRRGTITDADIVWYVDLMVKYIDAAEDDLLNFIPKISMALQLDNCRFIIPCRAGFKAWTVEGGDIWNALSPFTLKISNEGVLHKGGEYGQKYFKEFRYRTQEQMLEFFRTLALRIEVGTQEGWPW